MQGLQQKRAPQTADTQLEVELENSRQTGVGGRKKAPKISPTNKGPASPSNNSPMSPPHIKSKNTGLCLGPDHLIEIKTISKLRKCHRFDFVFTDSNLNVVADLGELGFRALSPALSNRRGSQCSQVNNETVISA